MINETHQKLMDLKVQIKNLQLSYRNLNAQMATLEVLRDACKAALVYHEAIQACANDPEKMASFCMAEGDDLDRLYGNWISKAVNALQAERSSNECEPL